MAFTEQNPDTGQDILMLPQEGDRTPLPFLNSTFNEHSASFSPNGMDTPTPSCFFLEPPLEVGLFSNEKSRAKSIFQSFLATSVLVLAALSLAVFMAAEMPGAGIVPGEQRSFPPCLLTLVFSKKHSVFGLKTGNPFRIKVL